MAYIGVNAGRSKTLNINWTEVKPEGRRSPMEVNGWRGKSQAKTWKPKRRGRGSTLQGRAGKLEARGRSRCSVQSPAGNNRLMLLSN